MIDIHREIKKIDRIVAKIQAKIDKDGAYENAGDVEIRKYFDTLPYIESYTDRTNLKTYFYGKIDNLKYNKKGDINNVK